VFVTDGGESPPLSPRYHPAFDDKPGEVQSLIVGVGDLLLSAIPKFDTQGQPLGFWRADEVLQTDPYSQRRGGSVAGELLVEEHADAPAQELGATPGSEHFSSLREGHLWVLAREQGLAFVRLQSPQGLADALTAPALARSEPLRVDASIALPGLAFCLLLVRYAASR